MTGLKTPINRLNAASFSFLCHVSTLRILTSVSHVSTGPFFQLCVACLFCLKHVSTVSFSTLCHKIIQSHSKFYVTYLSHFQPHYTCLFCLGNNSVYIASFSILCLLVSFSILCRLSKLSYSQLYLIYLYCLIVSSVSYLCTSLSVATLRHMPTHFILNSVSTLFYL